MSHRAAPALVHRLPAVPARLLFCSAGWFFLYLLTFYNLCILGPVYAFTCCKQQKRTPACCRCFTHIGYCTPVTMPFTAATCMACRRWGWVLLLRFGFLRLLPDTFVVLPVDGFGFAVSAQLSKPSTYTCFNSMHHCLPPYALCYCLLLLVLCILHTPFLLLPTCLPAWCCAQLYQLYYYTFCGAFSLISTFICVPGWTITNAFRDTCLSPTARTCFCAIR